VKPLRLLRHIRSSLWFVPVVCVLVGVLLSFGTIALDEANDFKFIPETFTGGPDAALGILSTIAASMVSLTALVLTITMVVVQLAMGQFSPRIVQTILQDKPSQLAIGIFVATFAHAMLAMREISFDGDGQVPGLAIVVAYILILISVVVLVLYVHHIGRSLRVSALIELVGSDTRELVDSLYPDRLAAQAPPDAQSIPAPSSGVITCVNHDRLVSQASDADCVLELLPALGEFVPAGAPMFRIHGDPAGIRAETLTENVIIGLERTLEQDAAYGLRLLVDIAERSLSDSPFQDPTTAVQALDRLHDCLRQLACRQLSDGRHYDEEGELRLVVPAMDWDDYVQLAFDEIRLAGAASPQVTRRLVAALHDLKSIAPTDRHAALDRQLELLSVLAEEAIFDERDVTMALHADRLGIGVHREQGTTRAI
jgi:uncharacterized membrane protein